MLRLTFQQFRCWENLNLEIPVGKITLINGASGIGKTTILEGINWCIYGKKQLVTPNHIEKANTYVKIEMPYNLNNHDGILTITRQKNPNRLTLSHGDCKYEDKVAQSIINDLFGSYDIWLSSCYIGQGVRNNFLTAANISKMDFLNSIAFHEEDPTQYIENIDNYTKGIDTNYQNKLNLLNSNVNVFSKLIEGVDLSKILSLEQTQEINFQIVQLSNLHQILKEVKNERDINIGMLSNLQQQLLNSNPESIIIPEPDSHLQSLIIKYNSREIDFLKSLLPIINKRDHLNEQLKIITSLVNSQASLFSDIDKHYTIEDYQEVLNIEEKIIINQNIAKTLSIAYNSQIINDKIQYYRDTLCSQERLKLEYEIASIQHKISSLESELKRNNKDHHDLISLDSFISLLSQNHIIPQYIPNPIPKYDLTPKILNLPDLTPQILNLPDLTPQILNLPDLTPRKLDLPDLTPRKLDLPDLTPRKLDLPDLTPRKLDLPDLTPRKLDLPDLTPRKLNLPDLTPRKLDLPDLTPRKLDLPDLTPRKLDLPDLTPRKLDLPDLTPKKIVSPKYENFDTSKLRDKLTLLLKQQGSIQTNIEHLIKFNNILNCPKCNSELKYRNDQLLLLENVCVDEIELNNAKNEDRLIKQEIADINYRIKELTQEEIRIRDMYEKDIEQEQIRIEELREYSRQLELEEHQRIENLRVIAKNMELEEQVRIDELREVIKIKEREEQQRLEELRIITRQLELKEYHRIEELRELSQKMEREEYQRIEGLRLKSRQMEVEEQNRIEILRKEGERMMQEERDRIDDLKNRIRQMEIDEQKRIEILRKEGEKIMQDERDRIDDLKNRIRQMEIDEQLRIDELRKQGERMMQEERDRIDDLKNKIRQMEMDEQLRIDGLRKQGEKMVEDERNRIDMLREQVRQMELNERNRIDMLRDKIRQLENEEQVRYEAHCKLAKQIETEKQKEIDMYKDKLLEFELEKQKRELINETLNNQIRDLKLEYEKLAKIVDILPEIKGDRRILTSNEIDQYYTIIGKLSNILVIANPKTSSEKIREYLKYRDNVDNKLQIENELLKYIKSMPEIIVNANGLELQDYINRLQEYNCLTKDKIDEKMLLERLFESIKQQIAIISEKIGPNPEFEMENILKDIDNKRRALELSIVAINAKDLQDKLIAERQEVIDLYEETSDIKKLRQYAVETECRILQQVVDSINTSIEGVCSTLFDKDIRIILNLFKTVKSSKSQKPEANFSISYKGGTFNDITHLSGGEGDRASLALTLALNRLSGCPILMLDESLASLDINMKDAAIRTIRENTNNTVLIIMHDGIEGIFDESINIDDIYGRY